MRVFVTGATGFLGPYLARRFRESGHEVTGGTVGTFSDREREAEGEERIVTADVVDRGAITRALEDARPEIVVHLAGLAHVGESWHRMAEYFTVNVVGTENVTVAARALGARVILASSAEVYGPVPEDEQPIAETRPVAPATPYALTKACAERFVLAAGGVVVRAFNVIGPGQAPSFALPAFARQLAAIASGEAAEPVLRVGNLSARRDFVHPEDAAAGFEAAAVRGASGGVYNIACGEAVSIGDALDLLVAESGLAVRVENDPQRMRPSDIPVLRGDSRRLRALDWQPRRSLREAITDLWRSVAPQPVLRNSS